MGIRLLKHIHMCTHSLTDVQTSVTRLTFTDTLYALYVHTLHPQAGSYCLSPRVTYRSHCVQTQIQAFPGTGTQMHTRVHIYIRAHMHSRHTRGQLHTFGALLSMSGERAAENQRLLPYGNIFLHRQRLQWGLSATFLAPPQTRITKMI